MPLALISGKDLQGLAAHLLQAVKGQVKTSCHRLMSP
jgi:hypothetical protein